MPDNRSGALQGSVGSLRWLVTLYRREQHAVPATGLAERLVRIADVHADIQPTYASTFYQSTQVDAPITHMINLRWQDYPPNIDVVVRSTLRPDKAGLRSELFRIRRSKEVAGRKRFIQLECELERSRITPDDSDATRNFLLVEPYPIESLWDVPVPAFHPDAADAAAALSIWDDGDCRWDYPE